MTRTTLSARGGASRTLLALLLLIGLLALPTGGASAQPSDPDVVTVGGPGSSTADVAIALSRLAAPTGADAVLIGRDDLFADSLPAGRLQGSTVPLLLTSGDALDTAVAAEVIRLGATRATILGGTAAISETVADALESLGLAVTRVAGASRIETAVEIAIDGNGQSPPDTAILARAFEATEPTQAFADALAAGAWAAETGWPVLLTDTAALSHATLNHVAASGYDRVIAVGGTAAISDAALQDLPPTVDVDRVAGASRAATAVSVNVQRGLQTSADAQTVILLEGSSTDAWAAGFAAAQYAAATGAAIVLSAGDTLPPETVDWLDGPAGFSGVQSRRLVCAASTDACEAAAELLAGVALSASGDGGGLVVPAADGPPVHHGTVITAQVQGDATAVELTGPCLGDGGTSTPVAGIVERRIAGVDDPTPAADGPCQLDWVVTRPDQSMDTGSTTIEVEVVPVTAPEEAELGAAFTIQLGLDPATPPPAVRVGSFCLQGQVQSPTLGSDGSVMVTIGTDADDVGLPCDGQVELTFTDGGVQRSLITPTLTCVDDRQVAFYDLPGDRVWTIVDGVVSEHVFASGIFRVDGDDVPKSTFESAISVGDCLNPPTSGGPFVGPWFLSNTTYGCATISGDHRTVFDLTEQGYRTANDVGDGIIEHTLQPNDEYSINGEATSRQAWLNTFEPGDCVHSVNFGDSHGHDLVPRLIELKAFRF